MGILLRKNLFSPLIIILPFLFQPTELFSQLYSNINEATDNSYQIGGALNLTFEIQKFTNYRLSLTGGIGKKIDQVEFLYPTFHTELQIYQGGMGSSLSSLKRQQLNVDWIISFMVVGGIREVNYDDAHRRFNPINFFTDDSSSPLQNPYFNSIALGTNFIRSSDSFKRNQYLGIFNLNIERSLQFTYYNDGTPFHWIGLGDGFDRYYTGGGFFAVYLDNDKEVDLIQLSYNKFTGYQPYAFEVANDMQIDFLPYKDPESFYYNQSRWRGKIGSLKNGFALSISVYDYQKWDNQDFIHYLIDNSYHPDPERNKRWAVGFNYNYINFNSL